MHGDVHKLRLQKQVGRQFQKCRLFVNVYKVENCQQMGVDGRKQPKTNQRSL